MQSELSSASYQQVELFYHLELLLLVLPHILCFCSQNITNRFFEQVASKLNRAKTGMYFFSSLLKYETAMPQEKTRSFAAIAN